MQNPNDFLDTPVSIANRVASNFRTIRKARRITIGELSTQSGVSYSSIKRFEHTGEVSFVALIKLASVLGLEGEIKQLFDNYIPASIEEVF